MAKVFECERDGEVIRGESDDQLVANVERHVADSHTDLVGKLSRDEILAMGRSGPTTRGEGGSR
jgi:hypothetical protein